MPLIATGTCNLGRTRKINQDNIYLNAEKNLFFVADGMGGHEAGEIASQMAIDHFVEFFFANPKLETQQRIRQSIIHANKQIKEYSLQEQKRTGMGTTFVGLVFEGSSLYVCNVGDSRTYLMHKSMLFQLTKDHSLIQEKINLGIYTRNDAAEDRCKNVLTQAVGFDDELKIDIYRYKIHYNDIFILCSDGLHGMVPDPLLQDIVKSDIPHPDSARLADVEKTVRDLVQTALVNGGKDNISCILVLAQ